MLELQWLCSVHSNDSNEKHLLNKIIVWFLGRVGTVWHRIEVINALWWLMIVELFGGLKTINFIAFFFLILRPLKHSSLMFSLLATWSIYKNILKQILPWNTWLAQLVEYATLDTGSWVQAPRGAERLLKNEIFQKKNAGSVIQEALSML